MLQYYESVYVVGTYRVSKKRGRAEKDGTKKRDQNLIIQEKPLSFKELTILAGILIIESSTKCIYDFQTLPIIKEILSIE